MLTWFHRDAPIKRKLTLSFGALSLLTAASSTAVMAQAGIWSPTGAATAVGATALSLLLGYLCNRLIADPYVDTVVRMERLAAGDLESPVHYTQHRDCVGRMTRAMATFRQATLDRDRLQAEAATQHARAEARLRDTEAAHREMGRAQAQVVGELQAALAQLAAGDLTGRLERAFAADYEPLRADYNSAIDRLEAALARAAEASEAIAATSSELTRASDHLSHRTEQQAASLETSATTLDQVTGAVARSAAGAGQARRLMAGARVDVDRSGEIVRRAVTAMGEVERTSREIGQIIGVIDEIAFQTNLLALNAGVEAARAGDAGRGFAVVASEVRALAQRSAASAKEIKGLVAAAAREVQAGATLVGETGRALEGVVEQVAQVDQAIAAIADTAGEQAHALGEVNRAVGRMGDMTQQNAAMAEQSTAASHGLTAQTADLAALIAGFRLQPRSAMLQAAA